jgi:DNA-binding PadR family transcriptional regulator
MLSVLAALGAEPAAWQHGYRIAKDTGLKSGALYPILIRLSGRGLVEARWDGVRFRGTPEGYMYRVNVATCPRRALPARTLVI